MTCATTAELIRHALAILALCLSCFALGMTFRR